MNLAIAAALDEEREYQDGKYNGHKHSVPEYLLILENYLNEAKMAWMTSTDQAALHELRKVSALTVACFEEHGCPRRYVEKVDKPNKADHDLLLKALSQRT